MFYIIENLRKCRKSLKEEDELTSGLFLGRRFFPPKQEVFNSGGAGYIMDKKALNVLGRPWPITTPSAGPIRRASGKMLT